MPSIDAGLYLNLFPVEIPGEPVEIVSIERAHYVDLRPLRQELEASGKDVWVFADGDAVYGYGRERAVLQQKGFTPSSVRLSDIPRLTTHMILEGLIGSLTIQRYMVFRRKARLEVFNWEQYQTTSDDSMRVYRGFDLRSMFVKNRETDKLGFGLAVDVTYALKDQANQSLNMANIRERFGAKTFAEVRQLQGDLLTTGRINTEVARQRLLDHILPFVSQFPYFQIPCGVSVELKSEPVRIILAGESG